MLGRTNRIHFVGIGGIGMSGIAEFLHKQGFTISGSDMQKSETTRHLEEIGIEVKQGHDRGSWDNVDVVVKSSAVTDENPEIADALANKIPVIRRAEMLAEIMRMSFGIGIAGTHGKTTTTSMVGMIMMEAKLEPTIIVGGKVKNFSSNNLLGSGKYIVVEADEFDRSFLALTPIIAGITNIELDHLDCYKNLEDIKKAFIEYANKVPFFGFIAACLDDKGVQSIIPDLNKRLITYGFSRQSDIRASNITSRDFCTRFSVVYQENILGEINLNIPGKHNILNALLSILIAIELEIDFSVIKKALEKFKGVFRRFEYKGSIEDICFYDDYAHHPTEIIATLEGMKESTDRRIVALFQPHLFSRTKDFYEEFGRSFFFSDVLVVTPVYPAREKPIPGVTGKMIADAAIKSGHRNVHYIDENNRILEEVEKLLQPHDIVVTIGAGDIYKHGEKLLSLLKEKRTKD
jgi:UDP-N-acetylmuramate--alanine ligase